MSKRRIHLTESQLRNIVKRVFLRESRNLLKEDDEYDYEPNMEMLKAIAENLYGREDDIIGHCERLYGEYDDWDSEKIENEKFTYTFHIYGKDYAGTVTFVMGLDRDMIDDYTIYAQYVDSKLFVGKPYQRFAPLYNGDGKLTEDDLYEISDLVHDMGPMWPAIKDANGNEVG